MSAQYSVLTPGATAAEVAPSPDQSSSKVGANLVAGLKTFDKGKVCVELNSVYGAAVMMPQLARTCGWPEELLSLTIASYVYLFLCILVHGAVLVFMQKSDAVSDGFAGQPYLCDFGAEVDHCKEGDPSCLGADGTTMIPVRLYGWGQWVTRAFVRDSLVTLFPDQADDIRKNVDPGEYGLESYYCRLLCVFVFLMSVIQEMYLIFGMVKLFYFLPNENQSWIEAPPRDETKENPEAEISLENIKVKTAGMSIGWKIWTALIVLVPKAVLFFMTVDTGVSFLMETAGIDDIIVNSVALGFLLSMDEAIVDGLMSAQANYLLENCGEYEMPGGSPAAEVDSAALPLPVKLGQAFMSLVQRSLFKLILTILLTFLFVWHYYHKHCEWDGYRYVSKPVYIPAGTNFNFFNALMPAVFPIEVDGGPYWTMPTDEN